MTWVKICGITNLEDALMAVEAGADALGFVFYDKSPRNVDTGTVREIVKRLPGNVEKVGVFVDSRCEDIRDIVMQAGLTAVQLHGKNPTDALLRDLRTAEECVGVSKVMAAIAGDDLKKGEDLVSHDALKKVFAILLDSRSNGSTGGTGTTFDWKAAQEMVHSLSLNIPIIIAGGLTAANVGKAIQVFQPFGVDVATGVEARPGKKDREKVRVFIRVAHESSRRQ
jgi:phosphoribosylanthranilate isomerase